MNYKQQLSLLGSGLFLLGGAYIGQKYLIFQGKKDIASNIVDSRYWSSCHQVQQVDWSQKNNIEGRISHHVTLVRETHHLRREDSPHSHQVSHWVQRLVDGQCEPESPLQTRSIAAPGALQNSWNRLWCPCPSLYRKWSAEVCHCSVQCWAAFDTKRANLIFD